MNASKGLGIVEDLVSSYKHIKNEEESEYRKPSRFAIFFIFITAVVCITICSKSSPLYPFNDWVDANCFFTVGKSVANGKVLYKDIYEQKGPFLYLLYAICYYISPNSFLGVYIFEILSCFSFLFISYKTLLFFCYKEIVYTIPFVAAIVYGSHTFSHGGSAEELCLPLLALCFYFGMKSSFNNEKLSPFKWFIMGVVVAIILWTKYTLLGIFIGTWIFFLVYCARRKDLISFLLCQIPLLLGIALGSLPVILYFAHHNALPDLFQVYFHNNIFLYPTADRNSAESHGFMYYLKRTINDFSKPIILMILGIIFLIRRRPCLYFFLTTLATTTFFIFCGGKVYVYYSFILSVFTPLGMVLIFKGVRVVTSIVKAFNTKPNLKRTALGIYLLLCAVILFVQCNNTYLIKYKKSDMPQYIFNDIISQTENPTLLNYGFLDGGFYTVSGIIPNCKYFCTLNIPIEEMKIVQDKYVSEGLVDFVVTRGEELSGNLSEKYELVSTSTLPFEGKSRMYYLYKKLP